jgi:hypothetical protein
VKLYAVRIADDKQPVGFFWSRDRATLALMIDAVTDPGECEFREIRGEAFIVWEGPETWGMGIAETRFTGEESADDPKSIDARIAMVRRGMSFDDHKGGFSDHVLGTQEFTDWHPVVC